MCMRTTTRLWEPETMSLTATASIIGVRCLAMLSTFSKQNLRAEPVQSDPLKDAERQPTGVIFHRFRHRRRRPRRISRYRVSVLPISRIPGPSLGDWPSTLRSPTHCVRDFPPTVFRNRFPAATERRRCWELNTRVSLCPRLAEKKVNTIILLERISSFGLICLSGLVTVDAGRDYLLAQGR